MELLKSFLWIIIGFILLVKGADLFVDNAAGLARKLGVSSLVIGLTVVAFGTSLPELSVSMIAAIQGSNEIAVGNVVGSNIFNLLIVAGLSACIYPVVVNPTIMKRDWPLSMVAAVLLILFLIPDLTISRMEAIILLVVFVYTLYAQFKDAKQEDEERKEENKSYVQLIGLLILGIIGIVIGGQFAVDGAIDLAHFMGLSETLIGLTIVAIGTSLPELVTSVVAARNKESEIALGNVIGSNLFNIFFILGFSTLIHPIQVEFTAIIDGIVLAIVSFIYWIIVKRKGLDRKVGACMVMTYILYTIYIIVR